MADTTRIIAIGGTLGAIVAGSLAAPMFLPAVLASEPAKVASASFGDMFAKPFDPKGLVKFDITFDDSVSTEVKRSVSISKIGYGQRTYVSIVTTPSGTYSSDALTSPYVRYPGIDVAPKNLPHSHWAFSSFGPNLGTGTWSSFSSGSFTYFTYSFKPAAHSRG